MQSNENTSPLLYYHESWWKVKDAAIWYLAGADPEYRVGWYFNDETDYLDGPYETRAEAEAAFEKYCEQCL